jgi:hypothetical protein
MRTLTCSSTFPRLIGCLLACYAASSAAAPVVLLEKARLVPTDGAPEGGFGRAIAIDGNIAVATANAQPATMGVSPDMPSAAYVFERQASGAWIQTAKLSSGVDGDLYGIDVAIDNNVIVIGAVFGGVAYVYEKVGGSWQQTAVLGAGVNGGSGYSVAIQNNLIAIGEGYWSHGLVLYRREATGWTRIANYDNGIGLSDDEYYSPRVDISQNFAIHGSWGFDTEPPTPSTAYIYAPGAGGNWAQPTVTALTQPGTTDHVSGWSRNVAISASTALIDQNVFRYVNGQWHHELRLPGAAALDDDDATITAYSGPFSLIKLHRRTSAGAWPVRAELAVSNASSISSFSTDAGRVLLASRPNPAAFLYETPASLDRPALAQDDFQDGDAIGWATTPGSLFAVASSGTFRFYRQTNTTGNAAALWQGTIGGDQAIQADLIPRAFDGADRWFGLVTRYTDANNYYYVTARSGGGIQLKRMLGGAFTTLGSAALPVAIGATHRIRLESVEDHIRVLVNNRPVITVRDTALRTGRPGLMTYRARVDFDNVVVNANPAVTAYTNDFQAPNYSFQEIVGAWARAQASTTSYVYRQYLSGGARAFLAGQMRGDQIVEADLRPTQFSGTDRWVGLMARYRDDSNYHYVTLRSSGSLDIKKLVNGSIQTLVSVPFTVQTNVSYRVRLETIGTRVRVYINGTLRAEATDASAAPASSGVGLATYKATMDADNFLVTQP